MANSLISILNFPFTLLILLNVLMESALLKGAHGFEANFVSSSKVPPEIRVAKWISVEESDYYDDESGSDLYHFRNWNDVAGEGSNEKPLDTNAIHISGFGSHEYIISQHVSAVLFECRAPYPVQWVFHNAHLVTEDLHGIQMKTYRHSKSVTDPKGDTFTASLELSMESNRATGHYSCKYTSQSDGSLANDIFIYWAGSGSSPPYLVLAGKVLEMRAEPNQGSVTIPCYVSSPAAVVRLFKEIVGSGEFKELNRSSVGSISQFDPKTGFNLSFQNISDVTGRYRCQTDGDDETDLVEILVMQKKEEEKLCSGNDCLQRQVSSGTRFYFDESKEELVCCGRGGSKADLKPTRLHTLFCVNPSTCAMFEPMMSMSSGSNGKRSLNGSCVSEKLYPRDFGLARCRGDGIDVLTYVYTEFWTPDQENLRAVFNWKEVNPENMVHLMIHTAAPYYNRQLITATCQTLHSYFSDGIKWAIKWGNGSLSYFDSIASTKTDPRLHGVRSTYLRLNLLMSEVICFAPVWNSTVWIEKSLKINVKPSRSPIIKGSLVEEMTFALNDTEKILECVSSAQPPAKIKWRRNEQEVPRNMIIWNENGTSVLLFKTVTYQTHGVFECFAKNEVGVARKIFRIFVEDTRHSTWSLAFTIVIPVLVICFLAIVGIMVWKVKAQGKVVDHLTRVVFRDTAT